MIEPVILKPYSPELNAFYELWKFLKQGQFSDFA